MSEARKYVGSFYDNSGNHAPYHLAFDSLDEAFAYFGVHHVPDVGRYATEQNATAFIRLFLADDADWRFSVGPRGGLKRERIR